MFGKGVRLYLLGGFRLQVDGELVRIGLASQRLLALLACRGHQVSRAQLAHTLWPDTTSARAQSNLRTALYRLSRACPGAVSSNSSHLRLGADVQVDLEHTTGLASRLLGGDADRALLTEALRADFQHDLLPDWDDEWLDADGYRHRQLRLAALELLATNLAAAGHHGAAVQAALAAVQDDPLRESAHEALIRVSLAEGNRGAAIGHYTTYRRILRDELGLDPPTGLGELLYAS